MDFVKLLYNRWGYTYSESPSLKMDILLRFLTSDVRDDIHFFKEWALSAQKSPVSGNITLLSKRDSDIYLSDLYSDEEIPTQLKMSTNEFIRLLDDWWQKVCGKEKPNEVIIKHDSGKFVIETKN